MPLSDTLADLNNTDVKIRWGVFGPLPKKEEAQRGNPMLALLTGAQL